MSTIYCDKAALPLRREHDFYPTDRATAAAAVRAFQAHIQHQPDDTPGAPLGRALDPGAGTGVWGEALALRHPWRVTGVELRGVAPNPHYERWIEDNFLTLPMDGHDLFDLVLGNPPYRHAESFVERALCWVKDGGHVLFLLPLSFLESRRRRDGLYRRHPLARLWVCSKRPSFQPDGKSSPTAYGVYLWQKGLRGEATIGYLQHE